MEGDPVTREMTVATVMESGVPGLELNRTGPGGQWRLVHRATGLMVSRSAVSSDPEALVHLARELAPAADWTRRELPVPGPALRHAVEAAAARCGLTLGQVAGGPAHGGTDDPDGEEIDEVDELRRDLDLVSRLLRVLHTAVPPAVLASAIADLDASERARLRELLTDGDGQAPSRAVVQPISVPRPTAPTRQVPMAPTGVQGPAAGPGSAAG